MTLRRSIILLLLLLALGAGGLYRWASAMPQAREFGVPPRTAWAPRGVRQASLRDDSAVIPLPDAFHTMHVGVSNTDELWGVAAPMVRFDWTAEEAMYIAEGPTYDNQGNLYFSPYNPNSGRLYVAATAPDEQDGATDGVSQNGAVYALEVVGEGPDQYEVRSTGYYPFSGGTGSTPTVSLSSDRLMLSDDNGNVIALDTELNELWRVNVGGQVAASIAVSADNREVYAVTQFDIVKLIDRGTSAEIAWRAKLDVYPGFDNFNALTPTITANGIAVSIGGGRGIGRRQLMHKVGVGLLDRDTGAVRSFAEGREEAIAVTSIGPDGGYYLADSPVRRAVSRGILGDAVPPLVGGVQRYRPIRLDILVRDATCAAAARAGNAVSVPTQEVAARRDDARQIRVLIDQSRNSLPQAVQDGDLQAAVAAEIGHSLDEAAAALSAADLPQTGSILQQICTRID